MDEETHTDFSSPSPHPFSSQAQHFARSARSCSSSSSSSDEKDATDFSEVQQEHTHSLSSPSAPAASTAVAPTVPRLKPISLAKMSDSELDRYLLEKVHFPCPIQCAPSHQDQSQSQSLSQSQPQPQASARFSVLSWNVLARGYARKDSFLYASNASLDWKKRKRLLARVVTLAQADILCLQELDDPNFFISVLKPLGYDAFFAKRSGHKKDGCLTAWRTSRFSLFDLVPGPTPTPSPAPGPACSPKGTHIVEFNELARRPGADADRLTRDNVGLLCILQAVEQRPVDTPPKLLLVANAHLFWNPLFTDVKLRQTAHLMEEIAVVQKQMARYLHSNFSSPEDKLPPVVLCTDLNSLPSSSVYRFVLSGKYDSSATAPTPSASAATSSASTVVAATADMEDSLASEKAARDHGHYPALEQTQTPSSSSSPPQVKFAVESSLIRISKWLRIIGVDASVFPSAVLPTPVNPARFRKSPAVDSPHDQPSATDADAVTTTAPSGSGEGSAATVRTESAEVWPDSKSEKPNKGGKKSKQKAPRTPAPPVATPTTDAATTSTSAGVDTSADGSATGATAQPRVVDRDQTEQKRLEKKRLKEERKLRAMSMKTNKQEEAEKKAAEEAAAYDKLFEVIRSEQRVLVLQNRSVTKRRNCPPYFLVPARVEHESILGALAAQFNIKVDRNTFYKKCPKCFGNFVQISLEEAKTLPFVAPEYHTGRTRHGEEIEFTRCESCGRVRWWGNSKKERRLREFEAVVSRTSNSLSTFKWKDKPQRAPRVLYLGGDDEELLQSSENVNNENENENDNDDENEVEEEEKATGRVNPAHRPDLNKLQLPTSVETSTHTQEKEQKVAVQEEKEQEQAKEQAKEKEKKHSSALQVVTAEPSQKGFVFGNVPILSLQHEVKLASSYSTYNRYAGVYSQVFECSVENKSDDKNNSNNINSGNQQHAEPDFTNFTGGFQATIDYIFFSPEALRCSALLALPPKEFAESRVAFPNEYWPSDHCVLQSTFEFL